MSSSSAGSVPNIKKGKSAGFSESDVNLFLKRGASLASRRAGDPSISTETPGREVRPERGAAGTGSQFAGSPTGGTSFLGKFSTMSKEQIETLAATFKQREQNISQRRLQPGRSSLFMGRA